MLYIEAVSRLCLLFLGFLSFLVSSCRSLSDIRLALATVVDDSHSKNCTPVFLLDSYKFTPSLALQTQSNTYYIHSRRSSNLSSIPFFISSYQGYPSRYTRQTTTTMRLTTTVLLSLPLLAAAGPVSLSLNPRDDTFTVTADQLQKIAPTSNTCDNAPAPEQCATAAQAAPLISRSFQFYKVTSRAEQAAVIGLMAFESGQFKYNKNVSPGIPGQGSTYHPLLILLATA